MPYSAAALGVTGSFRAGGVGVVGGYLGGSAANKKFNPLLWDWKSPETIGGLFNGFTVGFNIVSGISGINANLGKSLNLFISANKNTFTAVAVAGAFGYGYQEGVNVNDGNIWFWEWNYSEDNIAVTLESIFRGTGTGISISAGFLKAESNDVKEAASKTPSSWPQHRFEDIQKLISKLPPKTAAVAVGAISAYHTVGGEEILKIFDFNNFDHQKVASSVAFLETFFEGRHNYLQSLELQKSLAIARKAIKEDEEWMIAEEEEARRINDEKVSQDDFFESDESSRNRRETQSILWNPREITSFQGFPSVVENKSSPNFNSSSFNVLDMGDKWMQQTEIIGNLTLLNLLMDKLFNNSKSKAKNHKRNEESGIEYQILSAEVVNEFVEKFVEHAEECGISQYLANEIIEKVIDLTNLTCKVKTEVRRKDFEQVLKLLRFEVAEKSLNFLKNKIENNRIAQLQEKLSVELINVQRKLEKYEEKTT